MNNLINCKNVTVLGAGSWGTALAIHLAGLNYHVSLWGKSIDNIQDSRINEKYIPNIKLPDNITLTNNLEYALSDTSVVFYMLPSTALYEILHKIKAIYPDVPFVWGSKGVIKSDEGFYFLDDAVSDILGSNTKKALISGPTFADEVAAGLPTAIVVASQDKVLATQLQLLLHSDSFRVYTSQDTKGIQICGVMKNILAIASGVSDGLSLGVNTRTALITRGLVEMGRVANKLGCTPETLMGLTGMGDLVLTCTSDKSRNRRLGLALGKGLTLGEAVQSIGQVMEGYYNAKTILNFAKNSGIELPITEQVCLLLDEKVTSKDAMQNLLNRAPRAEFIF